MEVRKIFPLLIVLAAGCQSTRYSAEAECRYEVRQDQPVVMACGKIIINK